MTSGNKTNRIKIYEWPLNPRVRGFLRYENLIDTARNCLNSDNDIATLTSLSRLLELTKSNDFKSDLMQNLTQQIGELNQFSEHKQADRSKLDDTITRHKNLLERFHSFKLPNAEYQNNHFLSNVFLRLSLTSGPCSFDIPQLQLWQQRPPEERQTILRQWLTPFFQLAEGIYTCLDLTRKSGEFSRHKTEGSYFSASPPPGDTQMLRIKLDGGEDNKNYPDYYPQVSANAQMLTLRLFRIEDWATQPQEITENTTFEIAYCTL